MATTVTVTRTLLSLADLSLSSATYGVLNVPELVAERPWRREVAASRYVHGTIEVGATYDQCVTVPTVKVTAASASALQTAVAALIAAFEQRTFTMTISVDGTDWAWTCQRHAAGMAFDVPMRHRHVARVRLAGTRNPIPVSGPL